MRNMMKPETIRSAIRLANKTNHILVATTSPEGTPHVAAAGELNLDSEDHVSVAAWFCPGTLANLKNNRQISVVVWDASEDFGYQLLGSVEHIDELAMMNGFAPEIELAFPRPQVERRLRMRVDRVYHFSHAPHSDIEEE
jgi:uncharacterized protein